jgi:hypothetical protein
LGIVFLRAALRLTLPAATWPQDAVLIALLAYALLVLLPKRLLRLWSTHRGHRVTGTLRRDAAQPHSD